MIGISSPEGEPGSSQHAAGSQEARPRAFLSPRKEIIIKVLWEKEDAGRAEKNFPLKSGPNGQGNGWTAKGTPTYFQSSERKKEIQEAGMERVLTPEGHRRVVG